MSYSEPSPEVEGTNKGNPNATPEGEPESPKSPPTTEEPDGTPVENPSGG